MKVSLNFYLLPHWCMVQQRLTQEANGYLFPWKISGCVKVTGDFTSDIGPIYISLRQPQDGCHYSAFSNGTDTSSLRETPTPSCRGDGWSGAEGKETRKGIMACVWWGRRGGGGVGWWKKGGVWGEHSHFKGNHGRERFQPLV